MKIMDFLTPEAISANLQATNKKEVIKELVGLLIKTEEITSSLRNCGIFEVIPQIVPAAGLLLHRVLRNIS